MRWLSIGLLLLLVAVQASLWLGKSGLPYVMGLRRQLAEQLAANEARRERNARVVAEVSDLKEGLEMVEEKARGELGMVKADEVLVQLTQRR
jgi:cell division protein FtsB